MDFNSLGTVLLLLLTLGIFVGIIIPKFSPKTKTFETIESIVEAAENGETKMLVFSSEMQYNICDQFDARYGCHENEISVEGHCELEKYKLYKIIARPYGTSVCLNVTLIGET